MTNSLPCPPAGAECLDAAAVQIHEIPHQGQADSQAPLSSLLRLLFLGERLEDARHHLGGNADPRIAHADCQAIGFHLGGQGNPPLRRRVFAGVHE